SENLRVLAIETSCDDTSVALVRQDGTVEISFSANQDLAHAPYGGIVPEIASRNHTHHLLPLIEQALGDTSLTWNDIGGIAVTNRPGLIGALIVGLMTAKSLSMAKSIPLIGVNHLEGHLLAPFLRDSTYQPPFEFDSPVLALTISGGHTSLVLMKTWGQYQLLGETKDDAAGEALDKFAKVLGLGFPGGAQVDRESKKGDLAKYPFPRAMVGENGLDFSFSGLKSSGARLVNQIIENEGKEAVDSQRADLCASYQEAVIDSLLTRLTQAVKKTGIKKIIITGGVSANSRLREKSIELAKDKGWQIAIPPLRYCTDNAAMIGFAGVWRLNKGFSHGPDLAPSPSLWDGDFQEAKS
ncbi:MAG: tRNA (adenosine(37)-N6)-threonylcarbamoyltransferase complex transferase subunit TsaD, partial [Bdellovibrionota bacterium]